MILTKPWAFLDTWRESTGNRSDSLLRKNKNTER